MKVAGIIAEYNPFHNGHKYHICETKKEFDLVVVILSGSFCQRGDVAIFSKWSRAKRAIDAGADLVIELPYYYATSSAEGFSEGAVKILSSLGVIDSLSFGSETADLEKLFAVADILNDEPIEFSTSLKNHLKSGLSYAKALSLSLSELGLDYEIGPNDMLATQYIKAIKKLGADISPYPIRRTALHDSDIENGEFLSASAIRERIKNGEDVSAFMTPFDEKPIFTHDFFPLIKYAIDNLDVKNYATSSKSDVDLINTLKAENASKDFTSYLYNSKSKRYVMSRVKRTLLHILTNSGEIIPDFSPYARILGVSTLGRDLLRKIKKTSDVKIITRLSDKDLAENKGLYMDVHATDIRNLIAHDDHDRKKSIYVK